MKRSFLLCCDYYLFIFLGEGLKGISMICIPRSAGVETRLIKTPYGSNAGREISYKLDNNTRLLCTCAMICEIIIALSITKGLRWL